MRPAVSARLRQLNLLAPLREGYRLAMYVLSVLAMTGGACVLYHHQVDLPTASLVYALMVVVAVIVIDWQFAGGLSLTALVVLTALGLLQSQRLVPTDTGWLEDGIQIVDLVGFLALFAVMAIATWSSRQEVERSFAQLLELQELAEMGKLTANLLHDLASPITVASLTLEQLGQHHDPPVVDQAITSIRCLERYVVAARTQLQHRDPLQLFMVNTEIHQVVQLLGHQAEQMHVDLKLVGSNRAWLYGDPVKFNRLILNLAANALEASAGAPHKKVRIKVTTTGDKVTIAVIDWGTGIPENHIAKLFKPFFSTKPAGSSPVGFGLAIARQITVDDFNGEITAISAGGKTRFTVSLPASTAGS